MQAPLTVFDRIQARLEKSETEGTSVVKFLLGKSEIDCLKEWCRADEIEEIEGSSGGFLFRGVAIEPVNFYSYFAYELLELALV
jgi:hypothetical protein